ncbi:MAG TPA: tyrosine-type recombinase/integrase [Solirubrobacteraceae bacterium]
MNVARHVELPGKPESAEIRFLEPLEVRALADAAVDGPYREIDHAMYLTAAMTGLRQGELVALRWRDVDWTAGRIRVRQNYPHTAGPLDKAAILRRFRRALKAARLEQGHRFHDLRPHVRHSDGRRGRSHADLAGVDGASGHRDNPALRGLLAERARVGIRGGGLWAASRQPIARLAGDVMVLQHAH